MSPGHRVFTKMLGVGLWHLCSFGPGVARWILQTPPPATALAAELRADPNCDWHCGADASNIGTATFLEYDTMDGIDAPVSDGVALRAMTPGDLMDAQALTDQLRWQIGRASCRERV